MCKEGMGMTDEYADFRGGGRRRIACSPATGKGRTFGVAVEAHQECVRGRVVWSLVSRDDPSGSSPASPGFSLSIYLSMRGFIIHLNGPDSNHVTHQSEDGGRVDTLRELYG